jgi:hypothetical protein
MSDEPLKAGAVINRQNMTRLQTMHDMAVQMGAACDVPGHDYTPIGKMAACPHCGHALEDEGAKAGLLDTEQSDITPYASMKAVGDRLLEVRVAYYGHKNGKDSHNEYFSPNTDFDAENFPAPPLLYYHGFDANGKKMGKPAVTGKYQSRRVGADGHYLTYKLKNTKHADLQWESAQKSNCVVSPGTIGHLIRKDAQSGELLYWPLAEISAWDYAANRAPANLHSVAAPVIKALYISEGLDAPAFILDTAARETPEALGESASEQAHEPAVDDIPLTDEERAQLVASIVADQLRTYRQELNKL